MLDRKPLAPNGRTGSSLMRELSSGAFFVKYPKSNERSSVFHYLRASQRQNGEGFGGGYRILK